MSLSEVKSGTEISGGFGTVAETDGQSDGTDECAQVVFDGTTEYMKTVMFVVSETVSEKVCPVVGSHSDVENTADVVPAADALA